MVDLAAISGVKRGPSVDQTQRLPDILKDYLRWHRIEGHTAQTISHYQRELGRLIRWLESSGHSLLATDLTSFDILAHLEDMKERGLAPKSLDTRLRGIKAWCKWMMDWEILVVDPSARVRAPRVPKEGKGFITDDQFQELLKLCPLNTLLGARRQAMLWLLATTGMRRSELWGLQLADLDWDRGVIHIRKGKGQKERWTPFAQEAQRPTLRYLHQRKDDYPCLWVSEEGRPIKADQIGMDLGRLMQRAGVEVQDVCHIFRRTWAANAERQHIPRPYIQAIAGWSTPTMLDRYVQAMQQGEEAIEGFKDFRAF